MVFDGFSLENVENVETRRAVGGPCGARGDNVENVDGAEIARRRKTRAFCISSSTSFNQYISSSTVTVK